MQHTLSSLPFVVCLCVLPFTPHWHLLPLTLPLSPFPSASATPAAILQCEMWQVFFSAFKSTHSYFRLPLPHVPRRCFVCSTWRKLAWCVWCDCATACVCVCNRDLAPYLFFHCTAVMIVHTHTQSHMPTFIAHLLNFKIVGVYTLISCFCINWLVTRPSPFYHPIRPAVIDVCTQAKPVGCPSLPLAHPFQHPATWRTANKHFTFEYAPLLVQLPKHEIAHICAACHTHTNTDTHTGTHTLTWSGTCTRQSFIIIWACYMRHQFVCPRHIFTSFISIKKGSRKKARKVQ